MALFEDLAHGIYCIDALYVKPQVASIYLLREGNEAAIIETGTLHSLPNVIDTLAAVGLEPAQIKYVIPTHVHLDHAGGAGAMMREFDQARLIIHPRGARHMIDPQRLIDGTVGVYGREKFDRLYGDIEPVAEERVIVADDMSRYRVGNRELVFFDTQGHARHHFCIYDEASSGVFTGDTFGISYAPMKTLQRGLLPTTPPSQFDPEALHASVDRIMGFAPRRLYLTHYGEYLDPAAQVASFHAWIEHYVALCRDHADAGDDFEAALQSALETEVMSALPDNREPALPRILDNDLRLNAQGLGHWWRTAEHG